MLQQRADVHWDVPTSGAATGHGKITETDMRKLFAQSSRLGLEITGADGELATAAQSLGHQASGLQAILVSAEKMTAVNSGVARTIAAVSDQASNVKQTFGRVAEKINSSVSSTHVNIRALCGTADLVTEGLKRAAQDLKMVRASSDAIQHIAREIQLLAVNAGVEAARVGVAGRGFAVIADSVKRLADQTRTATTESERHLAELADSIMGLQASCSDNMNYAKSVEWEADCIREGSSELTGTFQTVEKFIADFEALREPVQRGNDNCQSVLGNLQTVTEGISEVAGNVRSASSSVHRLVKISEDIVGDIVGTGVETPISGLIDLAKGAAANIATGLEAALANGVITIDGLFDEKYQPVAGTDPQQYLTAFTALTDRLMPPIQEPLLAKDKRVTFCAAVDRNGYLPTHNQQYSRPQGSDPVWNMLNCRNRRIFDDKTGLASARNRKPCLVQTYRRDMGGGVFKLMNELSVPIMVRGRHWGGFRIGFVP